MSQCWSMRTQSWPAVNLFRMDQEDHLPFSDDRYEDGQGSELVLIGPLVVVLLNLAVTDIELHASHEAARTQFDKLKGMLADLLPAVTE